ncbi:unnamed protein product, partial [Hymenolepis diminuta]
WKTGSTLNLLGSNVWNNSRANDCAGFQSFKLDESYMHQSQTLMDPVSNTYGSDVVNEKTCRRWFSAGGFKKDDFSLEDESRAGTQAQKLNSEQLQVAIDENPTCITRELSKTFSASRHMTIHREMKIDLAGKVPKAGKCSPPPPPQDLPEMNKQQRVTCCVSLPSHEPNFWRLF